MATLEQMMTALRNADASGNTQDAKRLAQLIQQTRKPADTSLLTGMQNSVYRAGQGIADAIPTAVSALTGMENPRLVIDKGGDGFQLSDLSTLQFKDASALTPEVEASNPLGIQGDPFRETADSISKARSDLNYAPKVSWEEVKSNPSSGNVLGFMGEQAITSLPDMAMVMLSTPAYFLSYVAPIANERAKNNGTAVPTPADLAYAATAAVTIAQAEKFGAKGIFGGTTGNLVTRPLKAGAKESVTEAIQNPVEYAGGTLGTEAGFDPMVAADQSLAGAVGGAGAGTGIRTTLDVTGGAVNLVSGGDTKVGDQRAASDVANDLQRIADTAGFDLMDTDPSSSGGAKMAVMDVHAFYAERMKELAGDIKERFNYKDGDREAERIDKVLLKTALRKGRNVAKNIVNKDDFAAIQRLAGDTAEGQQLINFLKRSNELTRVNNAGYKGGISRLTDIANPFDNNQGYSPARSGIQAMSGLATGAGTVATLGANIPIQAATVGAGRLIDKATGRRSKVARYIQQNAGNQGLAAPDSPSLRLAREAEKNNLAATEMTTAALKQAREAVQASQAKALNRQLDATNAPPTPNSPQFIMEDGTGLDKSGVNLMLAKLEQMENINPALKKAIDEYRTSVREGGIIEDKMLSPLIRAVNATVDSSPENQALMVRERNALSQPQVQGAPTSITQNKIETGKRDNQALVEELRARMVADETVPDQDKIMINRALDLFAKDLGSDPVTMSENILADAYDKVTRKPAVTDYVLPYVNRVRQQQSGKKSKELTAGEIIQEETNAALFDPIDTAEYEDTVYYHGTSQMFEEFDASKLGSSTRSQSAKEAFWFSDETRTAESYADYNAQSAQIDALLAQARAIEGDAQIAQSEGQAEDAKRLFEQSEEINRQAEDLEREITFFPERGQTLIPVRLPANLHEIDAEGDSYANFRTVIRAELDFAKFSGYDGLKIYNLSDNADWSRYQPSTHVAIFDPAKIRSKFAPEQSKDKDDPLLKITNPQEAEQLAKHVRGRQLRDGLEKLLSKAGEGVLKHYKKGDPIGRMADNFEPTKILTRELAKYLDLEGREIASMVQVGLTSQSLSNEDVELLMPHLVRGLKLISGNAARSSGFLGRYRTTGGVRHIDMIDIGEQIGGGSDPITMTGEMFLNTLFHEIGHAIEAQTALRDIIQSDTSMANEGLASSKDDIASLIDISRQRRKANWDLVQNDLSNVMMISGTKSLTIDDVKRWGTADWINWSHDTQQSMSDRGFIQDIEKVQKIMQNLNSRWNYLTNPAELGADLVATYMSNPTFLKQKFPKQAKLVRKAVNQSDLSEYISFHTIAGLLGAGAISSILLGLGGEEDEDKGVLSLGSGALSAA